MKSAGAILAAVSASTTMVACHTLPPPLSIMPSSDTEPAKRAIEAPMPHVVSDLEARKMPPSIVAASALAERDVASPKGEVVSNLSYLFGYLLAGAAGSQDELMAACTDVGEMGKLTKIGLSPKAIQAPLCNSNVTMPNATYAIVNSIFYNSKIFASQLINSVNNTHGLGHLCGSLRMDLIDFFPLISDVVKDGVCEAAGTQRAPQGFDSKLVPNEAAIQAARNTQSVLFAIVYAAAYTSELELAVICANAPTYVQKLNAEHINGSLVASTLCKFTKPIPIQVAKGMITSWMTRYYITVLENVSNSGKWKQWLCDNLDREKMDAVGLSGVGVKQQVCGTDTALMSTVVEDVVFDY